MAGLRQFQLLLHGRARVLLGPQLDQRRGHPPPQGRRPVDAGVARGAERHQPGGRVAARAPVMDNHTTGGSAPPAGKAVPREHLFALPSKTAPGVAPAPVAGPAETARGGPWGAARAEQAPLAGPVGQPGRARQAGGHRKRLYPTIDIIGSNPAFDTAQLCDNIEREPDVAMPAEPQWLLRLPEIIEELAALSAPVIDRSVIERVFRVRRRRAIHLLGWFDGYQAGRTFLVERDSLLRQLRNLAAGERFTFEKRRHEKLTDSLERIRSERQAARIAVPVLAAPNPGAAVAGLPPGVQLRRGCLTVDFDGVQELLGKLYQIAQAAAADFSGFEAAASGGTQPAGDRTLT